MDEMNEQETPVEEPAAEPAPCGRKRCGLLGGLISGAIVGGGLALLLAPRKGEGGARMSSSRIGGREGIEEEARLRAKVAMERAQSIAGRVTSAVKGAWPALRERLRDALEEGKEGIAEGQQEARLRYEIKTKRRRPR